MTTAPSVWTSVLYLSDKWLSNSLGWSTGPFLLNPAYKEGKYGGMLIPGTAVRGHHPEKSPCRAPET